MSTVPGATFSLTPLPPLPHPSPQGLRPFGTSILFMGHDKHYGFQLYQSDPSGNFGGWLATCIGANAQVRVVGEADHFSLSHLLLPRRRPRVSSSRTTRRGAA